MASILSRCCPSAICLAACGAGRAILFSTHIIADVEAISDRVLIIHQGRLLGAGSIGELSAAAGKPEASLEEIFAHLVRTSVNPDSAHA